MSEKPILFSGEMVRAIRAGRKTQTRRVVNTKAQSVAPRSPGVCQELWDCNHTSLGAPCKIINCPYGQPGMTLWVRETWASHFHMDDTKPSEFSIGAQMLPVWYRATDDNSTWRERGKWRPSIFMPRWASRINLRVTGIRVERVQGISEDDAMAEGISGGDWLGDPVGEFAALWDSINGARLGCAWSDNPWVWVVEFEVTR
jgi:hypothetical protein